jgi:hypothetical protein
VAVVAVVLLVASLVPPGRSVATRGPLGVVGVDKWLHVTGYGTLAALLTWAAAESPDGWPSPRPAWWPSPSTVRRRVLERVTVGVVGAVAYGALLETLQFTVAYRTASAADGVANATGAVAGAALAGIAAYWRIARSETTSSTPNR